MKLILAIAISFALLTSSIVYSAHFADKERERIIADWYQAFGEDLQPNMYHSQTKNKALKSIQLCSIKSENKTKNNNTTTCKNKGK
jgi:hypothetical protein